MKPLTDIQKERLRKAIKYLVVSIATAIAMALGLTSCNVTRTITTESRSLTQGDTAIVIQTKTTIFLRMASSSLAVSDDIIRTLSARG